MLEILNSIDTELYLFFNGMHNPFFDRLMMMVTGKFIWIPMYATVLFVLFRNFKPKQAIMLALTLILAVAFADQICASLLRPIFGRLRPSNPDNPLSEFAVLVNGYRGGKYGFPSCHAANSFALASFMVCVVKSTRFRIFIISWAVINSYSRLYLGVHYPFDLMVGAILGTLISYSLYCAVKYFSQYQRPEKRRVHTDVYIPGILQIAGMKNPYVRASDIMLGIGGITFFILLTVSIF